MSFKENSYNFPQEGTKVLRCPAGHAPKSCSFMKQSNQCAVSFLYEQCAGCPYQNQCKPKIFKRVAKIVTSKAAHVYCRSGNRSKHAAEKLAAFDEAKADADSIPGLLDYASRALEPYEEYLN